MVQFTPEERNAICMAYQRYKGTKEAYRLVIQEFSGQFPQARVPNNSTVIRIWSKQQQHFTVHNLNNSMKSPRDSFSGRKRAARSEVKIAAVKAVLDGDSVKPADDPTISSCRRNTLGMNATAWHRIATKDLQYHSYKARIRQEVERLDPAMIRRACMDVRDRCQKVIVSGGGYIE